MALLIGITLPLVLVTGFRIGEVYGAATMILIAYILLYCTHIGIGPFINASPVDNIININFYILVHVLVYYITIGLYREKERALSQLHTLNVNLEQHAREQLQELAKKELKMLPTLLLAHTKAISGIFACVWRKNIGELKRSIFPLKERMQSDRDVMAQIEHTLSKIDASLKKLASFEELFAKNKQPKLFSLGEIVKETMNVTLPNLRAAKLSLQVEIDRNHILKNYSDELAQILFFIVRFIKETYLKTDALKKRFIKIKIENFRHTVEVHFETFLHLEGLPEDAKEWEEYEEERSSLELYALKILTKHYLQGGLQIKKSTRGSVIVLTLEKL